MKKSQGFTPVISSRTVDPREVARFGSIRVVASPRHRLPFRVDAVVTEEDTYLVLGAAPEFQEVKEHPVRVLTEAFGARPLPPGSVLVRKGPPMRIHTIVYDLDREGSTWCESWVMQALEGLLLESERNGLVSLALPVLGGLHGGLDTVRFLELLGEALRKVPVVTLRRIWLVMP